MMESQVRQKHIDALGAEFGKAYHAIYEEWCGARDRHDSITELYGSEENCAVLNSVAPAFFGGIQPLLWNDLILRVSRLTDRPKGETLSLGRLEKCHRLKDNPELLARVAGYRKKAVEAAKPVRRLRNRKIAHNDGRAEPLEKVTMAICDEVLNHVHAALDAIGVHQMGSHLANEVISHTPHDSIVAYLRGLLKALHFFAGLIDPDDPRGMNMDRGRAFLRKLGREDLNTEIFDVMMLARRMAPPPPRVANRGCR